MRQIKKRHCCSSVQWLSFTQEACSQCLRICVEGLTVEGQMQYDRHERVNFEREQRKIFKLYRRTNVLQRRGALEQRVMQPFGFFF